MNKSMFIKEGLKEGFQDGSSKMADRVCYGYAKDADGHLTVNEPEAKIVLWIFQRYLAGDSLGIIADGLDKQHVLSPTGKEKWNRQAIDKLLSNEKYIGQVMLQKTVTENGRQIRNAGLSDRFLYHDNNPAIISENLFEAVQAEKRNRSCKHGRNIQSVNGQTMSL